MNTLPVLMILTSHAELGTTGKPTGLWAEELTTPFYAIQDAGFQVFLASPKGGEPPFVADSINAATAAKTPSVARFLSDPAAMAAFKTTASTASLDAAHFSAVFLPGGHGTMWDTATDPATARLVGHIFDANKPTAAVCHGPAGLVSAVRADGKSVVHGLRVNGFTNEEETAVGLMDVVPFHLETRLRELGGAFVAGPMWGAFAVQDQQLITGQNPASSELVAQHLVKALKLSNEG